MSVTAVEPESLPEHLVFRDRLARLFGVTPQTIKAWEKSGRLPPPIRIGRRSAWRPDVIARLLDPETES